MINSKSSNRSKILQYIYYCGETSKQNIVKKLNLSMPTTLEHLKVLMGTGLIKESGLFESTGGRKAGIIAGVPRIKISVGIDITANHIGFVLVDLFGKAIFHERISRRFEDSETYSQQLGDDINNLLHKENVHQDNVLGVGISIPGILDAEGRKIEYSHALGLRNFSCDCLSNSIGFVCSYENDASAAGAAEHRRQFESFPMVYLSLSNSVGGAFFFNSGLYPGVNRRSGEFGHMCLVPNGRRCYCGKDGCVDAYCSASLLSEPYGAKLQVFFEELSHMNLKAERLWNTYTDSLAMCVNNLRMAFDCNIILGGYVGGYIEKYLSGIQEKASWLNTFEHNADYLLPCGYKQEAAAIGAALRWIDAFFESTNERY